MVKTHGLAILVVVSAACGRVPLLRGGDEPPVPVDASASEVTLPAEDRDAAPDLRPGDVLAMADATEPRDVPLTDARPDDGRDARDADRPDASDADRPDASDASSDVGQMMRPRVLSLVLKGAPWFATQFTQGMAVDDSNRVYVGDHSNVFRVDGSSVSTYLTVVDVAGAQASLRGFGDLDIGPDGRLYIIASAFVEGTGLWTRIVRSSAAHQADAWVDLSAVNQPQQLSVISDGYVALISRDGLWTFKSAGGHVVYKSDLLKSTDTCATQDLAAAPSGIFLYEPGCNAYPLLRGNADGTGVGVLYETEIFSPSPTMASNFLCVARDPSGGFMVVVESDARGGPLLFHIAEDAQGAAGLTRIETTPSFAQAKMSQDETFGFSYCSIAVARDGTVFFQTYSQLWKVSP